MVSLHVHSYHFYTSFSARLTSQHLVGRIISNEEASKMDARSLEVKAKMKAKIVLDISTKS